MITIDDFLMFSDQTLDGFRRVIDQLDDSTVNAMPSLPEANTPYQIVTHTLAAVDWWTSHAVLGEPTNRDRPSEFVASGSVEELLAALDAGRAKLHELAPRLSAATHAVNAPHEKPPPAGEWTVGACMIHVYEEMAQHLGHLEITVDLLG